MKKMSPVKVIALTCVLVLVILSLSSIIWGYTLDLKPVTLTGTVGIYFLPKNLTFQTSSEMYKLTGCTDGIDKYIGKKVEVVGVIDGTTEAVCPPPGIMAPCRLLKALKVISYKPVE